MVIRLMTTIHNFFFTLSNVFKLLHKLIICIGTMIFVPPLLLLIAHQSHADDIDIFFRTETQTPNVLFVLDTSGSMKKNSIEINGEEKTRMEVLKSAFAEIMQRTVQNTVNVGIMRFDDNKERLGVMVHPIRNISEFVPANDPSQPPLTVRQQLVNTVNGFEGEGFTPITRALLEAGKYYFGLPPSSPALCTEAEIDLGICQHKNSTTSYLPPQNQCPKNFIILLSDGAATYVNSTENEKRPSSTFRTEVIKDIKAFTNIQGQECEHSRIKETNPQKRNNWNGDEDCGPDLIDFLKKSEADITTYTIAFDLSSDSAAVDFLNKLAIAGGSGNTHKADNVEELIDVINKVFADISTKTGIQNAFVAPATMVSQTDNLSHDNTVILPVLQPEPFYTWQGNLKKFKVVTAAGATNTGAIIDQNDNSVFLQVGSNRVFNEDAVDLWQTTNTNQATPFVSRGGVESHIQASARPLYWNPANKKNSRLAKIEVSAGTDPLQDYLISKGINDKLDDINVNINEAIDWLHGKKTYDSNNQTMLIAERHKMADVLHSPPVTVELKNEIYIIAGSNNGLLQIFDNNGNEKFAFMPSIMFDDIDKLIKNNISASHHYGVDGHITPVLSQDEKTLYVYFGLRRGGRYYYGLKFTDLDNPSSSNVTLEWVISPDSPGFDRLGQTWSKPVATHIWGKDVLIFTGGYDPINDSITTRKLVGDTPDLGNIIYIVNQENGEIIWTTDEIKNTHWISDFEKRLLYSFASSPAVIDIDGNGKANQFYAADTGGQLWRFDIHGENSISGGIIADLGKDKEEEPNYRRFYNTPDLSIISNGSTRHLAIGIGSGWRESPFDTSIQDYFFLIRQPLQSLTEYDTTLIKSDEGTKTLLSVPKYNSLSTQAFEEAIAELQKKIQYGWKYELNKGEKVFGDSLAFDGQVIFSTIEPSGTVQACGAPTAQSGVLFRLYAFDIRTTRTFYDWEGGGGSGQTDGSCDGGRCIELDKPISPTLHISEAGVNLIGPPGPPKTVPANSRSTFWYEVIEPPASLP